MRLAAALLAVLPALALAQGAPPRGPPPYPGVPESPPAAAPGGGVDRTPQERRAGLEKQMRLARALGLAEALDLDPTQAGRMNEVMKGFDARRKPVLEQLRGEMKALRAAAQDPKVTAQQVDAAVGRIFAARGQMLALDQEMLVTLGKDLAPEKRARMALFFGRFRQKMGMELLERMEGRGRGPGERRWQEPMPRGGPRPPEHA